MPLFRFVSDAGPTGIPSPAELDLPSLRDAQYEAVRYLGELLKDDGAEFWIKQSATMAVNDAAGDRLFTLELALT